MRNHLAAILCLVLAGTVGCSAPEPQHTTPEGVPNDLNGPPVTNGKSVWITSGDFEADVTLTRLDATSGKIIWSKPIGLEFWSWPIYHDGFIWLTAWAPGPSEHDTDHWLLKIDAESGEIIDQLALRSGAFDALLIVEDTLWLAESDIAIIDPTTVEQIGKIERKDAVGPSGQVLRTPEGAVEAFGQVWLTDVQEQIAYDPETYEITAYHESDDTSPLIGTSFTTIEAHDGYLWVGENPKSNRDDPPKAQRVDPETGERQDVDFYESPIGNQETDTHTFDITEKNKIAQIDKTTGKQVATYNADGFNMLPIGHKLWVHNGEELRIYETAQ